MLKTTFMRSNTLTKEAFSKFISDKSIVYLKIAELGAMGNSGGILLYVFCVICRPISVGPGGRVKREFLWREREMKRERKKEWKRERE